MAVYMESNPHRPWDALYPVVRGVPDSWRDATVYYAETDLPQLLYQGYRQGLADEKFCMGYFNVWGLDTASVPPSIRSVIAMAAGVTAEGPRPTCSIRTATTTCRTKRCAISVRIPSPWR